MRSYGRIANLIASSWDDRDATYRYFDELLQDRRGNRKGFPPTLIQSRDQNFGLSCAAVPVDKAHETHHAAECLRFDRAGLTGIHGVLALAFNDA